MTITDLSTAANATHQAVVRAFTADGAEIGVEGSFSVTPLQAKVSVEARNLDIPSYSPFFRDALPMTLAAAKADASVNLILDNASAAPRLEDSRVEVRGLALKAKGDAGDVRLTKAALDGIFVDMAAREVRTGVLTLADASVTTGVDAAGRATLVAALAEPSTIGPGQTCRQRHDGRCAGLENRKRRSGSVRCPPPSVRKEGCPDPR